MSSEQTLLKLFARGFDLVAQVFEVRQGLNQFQYQIDVFHCGHSQCGVTHVVTLVGHPWVGNGHLHGGALQ
jgi:hypothetical protein